MSNSFISNRGISRDYQEVSLIQNPLQTLSTLITILSEQLVIFTKYLWRYKIILLLFGMYFFSNFIDGFHKYYIQHCNQIVFFCVYWIVLGIASSIGFGTGLHTFVLYLGPHIAKVTIAANECSYFPEMHPSKWTFQDFLPCTAPVGEDTQGISFWTLLWAVQFEAFMWGFGTSIGELPPYFMAKAAAEAGKTNEEIEELRQIEEQNGFTGLIDKIKKFIYQHLKKHGFLTVMLCASVPNPLFDLAGITCGHFSIPFTTFFGATFIGKALIKVHLQTIFVILAFSKHHVEQILAVFENNFPFLKKKLSETLEKQKELLWYKNDRANEIETSRPLIGLIWEVLVTAMILYFLVSIINSVVNERRKREHVRDEEKQD